MDECDAMSERDAAAEVLLRQPDVVFATLFGSVASKRAGFESDLDVGLMTQGPLTGERKRALMAELATVTGRPVDLVDLREAGPVVLGQALRGLRLVCRANTVYAALMSRAVTDAADFLPARQWLLRQRRRGWVG